MPYSNGVYTVPPGTDATTLTAIDSSDYNALLRDLETALSALPAGTVNWNAKFPGYDGTEALPGYGFSADTNTGMWRVAADTIGWSVGGVKALELASGTLTLRSTDAGAAAAPILSLYRDSASPAAADIVGEIRFDGEDSAGNTESYATARARIDDPTSGSEDATMQWRVVKAGILTTYAYLGANAAGTATADAFGLPLGQISFPAAQNASSDVNTLDDYEEGTWTPVLSCDTLGNLTITYTTQVGTYTKVGRLVTVFFHIVTSAFTHTTAAGNAYLTGGPFAAAAGMNFAGSLQYTGYTNATFPAHLTSRITASDGNIRMHKNHSGQANSAVVITDFPTGGAVELMGCVTYHV